MEPFWNFVRDLDDLNAINSFIGNHRQFRRFRKSFRRWFDPMVAYDDDEFKIKYRFGKENMQKLIENVRDDLEGDDPTDYIPVELQVMSAIRHWGLNEV